MATNFTCKNAIKITKGTKLVPKEHQDGCFFRCVLKYDSNNEIKTDTNVSIKVGFNVFADDKLGYSANVWDRAFPTREVNGKTQTVFEWYESINNNNSLSDNISSSNFWSKYRSTNPGFGTTKSLSKGRKVQLAVGYRYLKSAGSVSNNKDGSYKITNATWSDDVKWLQYKGESKDGIYKQTGFICGCPETWECSRIKDASWCWPGNTKAKNNIETYKTSDKHYFQDIPTIPCDYNSNDWDDVLGGYRFAAIELKLMARIQHNSPYWGDGVVNYDFYSTSGDNFANNAMFENAKRSRIPQGDNEWDILATSYIVFEPVDCRKATYGIDNNNVKAEFYYNTPITSSDTPKWGQRFTDENDGTTCRYGFMLTQPNFDLDREVTYKEFNENHDNILNDGNHHLYFGKHDSINVNRLPPNKPSYLYNMKDTTNSKWCPAQIDCNYYITYNLKRFGDTYKNLSSSLFHTIEPPNVSAKPEIEIKEVIRDFKAERYITYKRIDTGKDIYYVAANKVTPKFDNSELTYENTTWSMIKEGKTSSSNKSIGPMKFTNFESSRYSFCYVDKTSFKNSQTTHKYYLLYDPIEVDVIYPDSPSLEMFSTYKDSKNEIQVLLDDDKKRVLKLDIVPFTTVTYRVLAINKDNSPYQENYQLLVKKPTSGAVEITHIDEKLVTDTNDKGYYTSNKSQKSHTVTLNYKSYDSNNVTIEYHGYNEGDKSQIARPNPNKPGEYIDFETKFVFPDTFKRYKHLENTFSNLKVCYIKGGNQIKLYPYLHKK